MPLTLRPIKWPGTGPAYRQKFPDYDVLHDGQIVGRIYRQMAAVSPATEWFWAINGAADMPSSGTCGSLDRAKAEFKANWDIRGHELTGKARRVPMRNAVASAASCWFHRAVLAHGRS
jgi:hypothetical protein